jgi:hypothetical protein
MPKRAVDLDALQPVQNGINTYNEKSLHADLKQWYAQADDQLEVPVDGFVIDLVRGDLLVEIQTGSFHPLKHKLAKLAENHPVRLVFPIAQEKWIIREVDAGAGEEGGQPSRRKSPWRGRVEHVFAELVYIPTLLEMQNFSLEVLLIREEEVRRFDARKARAWRRKGWVTAERRLVEVVSRREFNTPRDLADLLPPGLPEAFTARELAKALGQPAWLAQKMVYCLKKLGLITPNGRKGRAIRYSLPTPPAE